MPEETAVVPSTTPKDAPPADGGFDSFIEGMDLGGTAPAKSETTPEPGAAKAEEAAKTETKEVITPEPAKEPVKETAKVDDTPAKEEVWFDKGRGYKTQEDAIRNQDKIVSGLSGKIGSIESTINKMFDKISSMPANSVVAQNAKINPVTGKEQTLDESKEQIKEMFLKDETEALDMYFDNIGANKLKGMIQEAIKEATPAIKAEAIKEAKNNITWDSFLANNKELIDPATNLADPAKLQTMREAFAQFPELEKHPNALVEAKEIALSPGETTADKIFNWRKGKESGEPAKEVSKIPAAVPLANAGGAKAAPASAASKKDAFGTWAEGLDL